MPLTNTILSWVLCELTNINSTNLTCKFFVSNNISFQHPRNMKFQNFAVVVLVIPLAFTRLSFHGKVHAFELKGEIRNFFKKTLKASLSGIDI